MYPTLRAFCISAAGVLLICGCAAFALPLTDLNETTVPFVGKSEPMTLPPDIVVADQQTTSGPVSMNAEPAVSIRPLADVCCEIPEPGTSGLLTSGMVALALARSLTLFLRRRI
jgi:hypothetical protein